MSTGQTLPFRRPATNTRPAISPSINQGRHLAAEDRIVRIDEVCALTGLSRTTIWRRINAGTFPPSFPLGPKGTRAVGWLLSDIQTWIAQTAAAA